MKLKHFILSAILNRWLVPRWSAAQIKIGVAAALTGNAAQYGVSISKGFELAGA